LELRAEVEMEQLTKKASRQIELMMVVEADVAIYCIGTTILKNEYY